MRLCLLYSVLLFSLTRCLDNLKINRTAPSKAQELVDKAIAAHGGDRFNNLKVTFDFRGRHYQAVRRGGQYTYTRSFTDSSGQVMDVLNNNGFTRQINGKEVQVTDERKSAYSQSVNSVIYFALLPYGLNDAAVKKTYLGMTYIRQQPYHKVKVTFTQEGGGTDFQDVFVYLFHPEKFTLDYFAYSYETEGGGLRFREAINPVKIKGILFQDYINFEPVSDTVAVTDLDKLYSQGQLKELSRIELKNIQVTLLNQ